jgi:hypothetical protein
MIVNGVNRVVLRDDGVDLHRSGKMRDEVTPDFCERKYNSLHFAGLAWTLNEERNDQGCDRRH